MTTGPDALRFLLGPSGIDERLPSIEAGDKLGLVWTYLVIPASVTSPDTVMTTIDASVEGIDFSHEFFGGDPLASTPTIGDFRIDFRTAPDQTAGWIMFDRGASGGVYLDVTFSGTSTVYGPPIYVEFQLVTGFPVE